MINMYLLRCLVAGAMLPMVSAATASAQSPGISWSHDIAPLVYGNCTTCHHPGGAGPFSLLRYEDARRWAQQIATVTASRYMPPWLPQPGYGDFADERRLSDRQIAMIAKWVQAGMPQGDPAAAPAPPVYNGTWQYGTPDLVLTVEHPFTVLASGTDVFRNFVLPYPLQQTHYIRAMEIRPAVPQIVHHANLLIDRTASFRRTHPDQWQEGVPGMELEVDTGNEFDPDSHFLFWKPDTPVLVEPDGMPWKLEPGNDLILNMHLKPSGKSEPAAAQIGLYFTDHPPAHQPMLLQLEHDSALNIPAGARSFVVEDELRLPIDVEALGIYPHAHYLGKRMEAWATLPDQQKKWLILIPDWDIDRQSVYRYRKPVLLPKGTVLHMRYTYDNSTENPHNPHSPPVRVKAGNRSEDEMAHLWLQVLPVHIPSDGPDPRQQLEEAWMRAGLRKDPNDKIMLYNLASSLAGQGKYAEAIATYRRLLVLHPDDERTLNSLGAALDKSGDWQQGRKAFARDVALHPETCDARFNLARADLNHADASAAEQEFRTMLAHCPADATIHSGLAAALESEGQVEAAASEFKAALAIDSNDFDALYNLGAIALQAGQTSSAADWLARAVSQRPADVDARQQLAAAYAMTGRMSDAVTQLRQAIALSPSDPVLHGLMSQALASSGQMDEALAEAKTTVKLRANDPDDWNNLGVLEARAGHKGEARDAFFHALQLAPAHAQARANLQRLGP
jgi:Flp pilus assembly protein TadD